MRSSYPLVLATILAIGAIACSGSKSGQPYGAGDPALAAANPAGGPIDPFLTNGDAVVQALHDVTSRYPAPLRLTSISAHISEGLIFDVVLPTDRAHVVRYIVAPTGKTLGPIAVNLLIGGRPATASDIAILAFDPATLAFARLTSAIRDAIAQSKLPDARVIQWGLGGANKHVYVIVNAPSGRRVALFDHQLRFVRMLF